MGGTYTGGGSAAHGGNGGRRQDYGIVKLTVPVLSEPLAELGIVRTGKAHPLNPDMASLFTVAAFALGASVYAVLLLALGSSG